MRYVLLLLSVPSLAFSLSVTPMLHDEATREADGIARGTIISVESVRVAGQLPITRVILAVAERLKGTPVETVLLEFVGGTVDGETQEVVGLRIPDVGDDLVAFYRADRKGRLSNVVGINQWYFWVVQHPSRFGETALETAGGLVVGGLSEGRIQAQRHPVTSADESPDGTATHRRQAYPTAVIDADGREQPVTESQGSVVPPIAMPWPLFREATLAAMGEQEATR